MGIFGKNKSVSVSPTDIMDQDNEETSEPATGDLKRKGKKATTPESREEGLPGLEHYNTGELNALEKIRDIALEEIAEQIGVEPFEDFELRVWRISPGSWEGKAVPTRRVLTIPVAISCARARSRCVPRHRSAAIKRGVF